MSRPPRVPAALSPTAHETVAVAAGSTRARRGILLLAVAALIGAWCCMAGISRTDPWYRNTDMNIHNLADALAINSDVVPAHIDQPGLPPKYLLALDFRVRHFLGGLPVWNFRKLNMSQEPFQEVRTLVHLERAHSRSLVVLFILAGAGLIYAVTRSPETSSLAVILLSGSSGLLFHGLIARPDLLCMGFGAVLAAICAWQATSVRPGFGAVLWLFLAGLFAGLAALSKLPGLFYVATCFLWCCFAALTSDASGGTSRSNPAGPGFWTGLLPMISGLAALWLLKRLVLLPDGLTPEAVLRLRVAAVAAIVLPLAGTLQPRHRLGDFLLGRIRELAVIVGGALAALSLGYGLLGAVMSGSSALRYLSGVTQVVADPGQLMRGFLSARPEVGRQFLLFARDTPFLLAASVAAVVALCVVRSGRGRLRAFIVFLVVNALGMALLLSRRGFLDQFGVYVQVPLLLAWPLGLFALGVWPDHAARRPPAHWAVPLALTAAVVILLSVYFRVQPRYEAYQSDATLPVNDLTLTFLYDHDAHPRPYVQVMSDHYGNRQQFAHALERYLADPAHRD